jgi:hypothetical protein
MPCRKEANFLFPHSFWLKVFALRTTSLVGADMVRSFEIRRCWCCAFYFCQNNKLRVALQGASVYKIIVYFSQAFVPAHSPEAMRSGLVAM